MKKATGLLTLLLVGTTLLPACANTGAPGNRAADLNNRPRDLMGNQDGARYSRAPGDTQGVQFSGRGDTQLTTQGGDRNQTFQLSKDSGLESRIRSIAGVRDATVLVSGTSAYVIIDADGTLGKTTGVAPGRTNRVVHGGTFGGAAGSNMQGASTDRTTESILGGSMAYTTDNTLGGVANGSAGSTVGGAADGRKGGTAAGTVGGGMTALGGTASGMDVPDNLKAQVTDELQRANTGIRNVFFITKFR